MSERSNVVKSVLKALDILEVLDKKHEIGISEISEILHWDKSTVHRLISTLKQKGYVVQNPLNQKYSNSFKLFEMGNNVVERLGLRRQAQPFLERLAVLTQETVNLAIMDGSSIIYIDKIESQATIKVDLSIGKKLPIYCTGLGKVMLAYKSREAVEKLLEKEAFVKYTKNTIENLEGLFEQLEQIRKQGYCIDEEEYVEGLQCIAAPVKDYSGLVIAAISVAMPKYRYDEGEKEIGYTKIVKDITDQFSKELGYRK
ncbi:IclR family transcriptional regulator [Clostridiaceae bacterium 35-E11]